MRMLIPLCLSIIAGCSPSPSITQEELELKFKSICAEANIDCKGIKVGFVNLPANVAGKALQYNTGRLEVQINDSNITNWNETTGILVHEVSHLVVFKTQPAELHTSHGKVFQTICHRLNRAVRSTLDACHR